MLLSHFLKQNTFLNKRVFLRADLNVPLHNGKITNPFKLEAIKMTIDEILAKHGKLILCTHIGRPQGFEEKLSTKQLIPWFESKKYQIDYELDLQEALKKSFQDQQKILLLENIRFYKEEKSPNKGFAKQLYDLAPDYYINDAFGLIHRTDCSIYELPQLYACKDRMLGFCIENELLRLMPLKNPEHPFLIIVGGKKVADKLPLVDTLLSKADLVFLGPPLVFTYLKAFDKEVGHSFVEPTMIQFAQNLWHKAQHLKKKIVIPRDYLVTRNVENPFAGPFYIKDSPQLEQNEYGITIGPKTARYLATLIDSSKTIFFNGLMGDISNLETLQGVKHIFEALKKSNGFSVVGGGDSTAAIQMLGMENAASFISTGGGALMAYITGQNLPALNLIEKCD